jgi:phage host-nuclease inhibitor protein Gam
MKKGIFLGITIIGLSTLLFTGCSKLPQAEIDAANAAIEQAKAAGADIYVNDSYVALQDSLNAVMVRIETEKSKFIKNYGSSKEELAGVTNYAGEVKQLAETRLEELKLEIEENIAAVNALVEANRQLLTQAPKGKEGTSALVAIKGEIDAIEASIKETDEMLNNGEYMATQDKVNAAKEKANSINTELSEVIAKYKANAKR